MLVSRIRIINNLICHLSTINLCQVNNKNLIRPETALWIIALPSIDMAEIMYRQIKLGRSPFRPDRDHLHHMCQRAGLSKVQTLMMFCGLSSTFSGIGIVGEHYQVAESLMFVFFFAAL